MGVQIILKHHSQQKQSNVIFVGISTSMISTFIPVEKKHGVYRDQDCMKKFRKSLREQVVKIIHLEKNKMIPLTNEQ